VVAKHGLLYSGMNINLRHLKTKVFRKIPRPKRYEVRIWDIIQQGTSSLIYVILSG
jgi:hypothetical protein